MAKGNSKAKKIIIPVVAVVLVAALIVTGYFFWYKPKNGAMQKSGGGSDTKLSVTLPPNEISYETADYKGYKVPEAFVEILEQAEKDSEKACRKYGTAMTVGENEISETEFAMTYFDVFIYMLSGEITDPQGIYPEATKAPAEQPYGDSGLTWADRITEVTAETLADRYIYFSEAIKNNFLPSGELVSDLTEFKEKAENNAEKKGISPDKEVAGSYFDGVTLNLCVRNLILRGYAREYEEAVRTAMRESHSDSEIKSIYEKNPSKYNFVDARIFEMPFDDSQGVNAAKIEVKDLESFYKFGQDYYAGKIDGYEQRQERETRQHFMKYDEFTESFGKDVAEWCFAEGRKEGDIDIIKGEKYYCLILIEKPQYSLESADYHECVTLFNNAALPAQNNTEVEAAEGETRSLYEWFVNDGGTADVLESIADLYNDSYDSIGTSGKREKVYVSSMDYSVARWLYSSERKEGDYDILKCTCGYGIYLFDRLNEGDLDAYEQIRTELTEDEFNAYYDSLINYEGYAAGLNSGVIEKAAQKGEKASAVFAEKKAERQSKS